MIHCRAHLLNWLTKAAKDDVLLLNALNDSGTRVELLGMFDPLPGSEKPGWLIRLTTCFGREELVAIVKDHLGRPDHIFFALGVDWNAWAGPNNDVLIGGDNNEPDLQTKVVHCKHDKYDILIDRTTSFGNPYIMGPDGNRNSVCDKHENWLRLWEDHKKEVIVRGRSNKWIIEHLNELVGKRIACYCAPQRCHGDNYVRRIYEKNSNTSKFHRIERSAGVYSQKNRGAGDNAARGSVDKKRSNPPNVPPSIPPIIT